MEQKEEIEKLAEIGNLAGGCVRHMTILVAKNLLFKSLSLAVLDVPRNAPKNAVRNAVGSA